MPALIHGHDLCNYGVLEGLGWEHGAGAGGYRSLSLDGEGDPGYTVYPFDEGVGERSPGYGEGWIVYDGVSLDDEERPLCLF